MFDFSLNMFDAYTVNNEMVLILLSLFVGISIGAEREYRNKSAGLRTFVLVSFASCVFTILSLKIGVQNPDRLAANILTGLGFLGAGVIFKDENKIGGITTATTIWATASLGMSIGSGHVYLGLFGAFLVLTVLILLAYLQDFIDNRHKIREYKISTGVHTEMEYTELLFKEYRLRFQLIRQHCSSSALTTTWRLTGNVKQHAQFVEALKKNTEIIEYQF